MKITEGTGLEIDWQDGHKSAWGFAWLRDACPCATCIDERKAQGRKAGQPKPKADRAAADVYRRPPSPPARTASAVTPSSSTGSTGTPAASIRGIICAATASARSARFEATESTGNPQLIAACDSAI